jgi:hypothetical protein
MLPTALNYLFPHNTNLLGLIRTIYSFAACYLLHSGLLFGLFFDPEDGGEMFLRNACWLLTGHTELYLRRQNYLFAFSIYSPDNSLLLYIILVRIQLEYHSSVSNYPSNTDSSKIERAHKKFSASC